jgi:hypothetical protein
MGATVGGVGAGGVGVGATAPGEGEGEGEAGTLGGAGGCGSWMPVPGAAEAEPVEADDELEAAAPVELASPAARVKALEKGDHDTGSFGRGNEPDSP